MSSLEHYWYRKSLLVWLLAPLSWLFCAAAILRRLAYQSGLLPIHASAVPVIVVGNVTVGGSGKTPLVLWLVERLRAAGYRPGIVSRGYRGRARHWPQQVRPDSDPRMVGDEPVLMARRCQCPVTVGPDRVAAVTALLAHSDCNVVISDDGLQHYAMGRDVEIAVVDGVRRVGNGFCLPAGPLREPASRLQDVDFVVCNGIAGRLEYPMKLHGDYAVHLRNTQRRALADFGDDRVHAVAGIGNPERFFSHLRKAGLQLHEHEFPDHHDFQAADIEFGDDYSVLMTEKDAVKCKGFAGDRHWYVPVSAVVDERLEQRLVGMLEAAARSSGDGPHGPLGPTQRGYDNGHETARYSRLPAMQGPTGIPQGRAGAGV